MAEHPRSARHVGVLHSAGILRARTSPSHGENRGSSPLGSANDFSSLAQKRAKVGPASPTFLQRTVLQTIGSRSRCDCRLEEATHLRATPLRFPRDERGGQGCRTAPHTVGLGAPRCGLAPRKLGWQARAEGPGRRTIPRQSSAEVRFEAHNTGC